MSFFVRGWQSIQWPNPPTFYVPLLYISPYRSAADVFMAVAAVVFHARWRLYFGRLFPPVAPSYSWFLGGQEDPFLRCAVPFLWACEPVVPRPYINATDGLLHNNWFPYLFMRHPPGSTHPIRILWLVDSVLTEFYCFRIVVNRCTCLWSAGLGSGGCR